VVGRDPGDAAGDGAGAADGVRLLVYRDAGPAYGGGQRGGQTGRAASEHHHVDGGIPLPHGIPLLRHCTLLTAAPARTRRATEPPARFSLSNRENVIL